LRVFAVVLSVKPLIVVLQKGYLRRASEAFVYEGVKPKRSYLTSFYSQQKHPDFKNIKESLIVNVEDFENYVQENLGWSKEKIEDKVWSSIRSKLLDVFTAVKDKLDTKKGLFEIVACDFMFSEDLEKNYLIEINMNPALFQSTEVLNTSIEKVVYKTLDNVLLINKLQNEGKEVTLEDLDLNDFELLMYEK